MKRVIFLFLISFFLCSGVASAWVSGYEYRMPININNTGNNLIDFQYNFTVDTATLIASGDMTTDDGSDCCIANSLDVLQEFWNETAFNLSDTKIWVNASSLDNVTNTTHYIYYGKAGASSLINGSNTFSFFDHFDYGETIFINDTSLDLGGFSCWANPRIFDIDGSTVWIYNTQFESSTESHMVRHVYNITTNTEISETSLWNDSGVICSARGFEKVDSTYHISYYYQTAAGADISLRKRESGDGVDFNVSTQSTLDTSTGEIWSDTIKISDSEFWIYYTKRVDATTHQMRRIIVNSSGYSASELLFTTTSARSWVKPKKFGSVYYLYSDNQGSAAYVRSSEDGLTFGSETTILSAHVRAIQIEKIDETYYMIYNQDLTTGIRVAKCDTPNGTFTYLQQLHTGYKIPGDTLIFDTDKILMTYCFSPENVDERFYVEQLSLSGTVSTLDTSKWVDISVGGTFGDDVSDSTITLQGSDFSQSVDNGEGIKSVNTVISSPTIMTVRYRGLTSCGLQLIKIDDNFVWSSGSEHEPTIYFRPSDNKIYYIDVGGWEDTLYNPVYSNAWHTTSFVLNGTNLSYVENYIVIGAGNEATTGIQNYHIILGSWASTGGSPLEVDYVYVRTHAALEPVVSLGAPETATQLTTIQTRITKETFPLTGIVINDVDSTGGFPSEQGYVILTPTTNSEKIYPITLIGNDLMDGFELQITATGNEVTATPITINDLGADRTYNIYLDGQFLEAIGEVTTYQYTMTSFSTHTLKVEYDYYVPPGGEEGGGSGPVPPPIDEDDVITIGELTITKDEFQLLTIEQIEAMNVSQDTKDKLIAIKSINVNWWLFILVISLTGLIVEGSHKKGHESIIIISFIGVVISAYKLGYF